MIKCIGCGSTLQNVDKKKEGYVKDLSQTLCERCFRIRHYNEYKFLDKDNSYYIDILKQIEKTNDLVVLVTDFLNIANINEIDIKNPVLLVLTKTDIIPRSIKENKILNKIKTNLKIIDKITVCSKNNTNLDLLFNKINKHKTSKDVYVIGYTNTGKSTLINKIIKNYGETKETITTSVLPSTTLDLIKVKVSENLNIIDTPGLLDKGSIILQIKDKALSSILPKKEIKPIVIQAKRPQIIIIDDILRLDVDNSNLIFYISNDLKIERYYKQTDKLINFNKHQIELFKNNDLVIKGLGFIKVTKDCDITLYLDSKVDYFIRDSLI